MGLSAMLGPIASGGMATVHLGRLLGAQAFRIALPPSYSMAHALEYLGRDEGSLTIRVQGKRGNAAGNGTLAQIVKLGDIGTAKVEVPEAARKALE